MKKFLTCLGYSHKFISKEEFVKKTVKAGVLTFIFNTIFLSLFYYSTGRADSVGYIFSLIALLITNLVSATYFSSKVSERINDFRGERKPWSAFFYVMALALPFAGLYLYALLCRKSKFSELRWSFRRHVVVAIFLPVLVLSPVRLVVSDFTLSDSTPVKTSIVASSLVYDISDPTVRFLSEIITGATRIFQMKERCAADHSCLKSYTEFKDKDEVTVSSAILGTAVLALDLFKWRDENPDKLEKTQLNIESALRLVESNLLILESLKSKKDAFTVSFPYGIYLFSGCIQVPLLMGVEELIQARFLSVALDRIPSVNVDVTKQLESDKLSFSNEVLSDFITRAKYNEIRLNEIKRYFSYVPIKLPRITDMVFGPDNMVKKVFSEKK